MKKLVRNFIPYSEPKAYYPAPADVGQQEHWLVYLTWTTLPVSAGIFVKGRGSTLERTFHRSGTN
ncbi:hypothetical protein [Aestuariivita boseongensis]|uniref:hypothetical protein n=1 Tax=Aestuariivita boseongensis TaxID=1470562 RepID=UPI00155DA7CE|nr:hypothetical protein [Aestuariivita boseongensis]